ncbi:uncharacterized protein LOC128299348 [Anopheles moucheti]|uniref:uncharacterized protein LOC128299348 n=1 Tax=Anopheles moucheti TaxID=186751 RepID=UPI0022F01AA3|nr:uncharacterized protein LOC128299348 [Anopheles moucheti]
MIINLSHSMECFYMILLLIACINGGLSASSESEGTGSLKYVPTAVSYVSFIKHIVPKRVENSMVLPKLSTRAPFHHHGPTRPEQSVMQFVPMIKPAQNQYFSHGQMKVQQEQSMPYHKTGVRPMANTYRPVYPTGYSDPVYVHSRIPLASTHVSGTREGNHPMVIGVQQPAYVKKYVQVGSYNPSWVRKMLTYAPKLTYVPHTYQRV